MKKYRKYTYLKKFFACFEQYAERNGEEFEILGVVRPEFGTENETDEDMFKIRFLSDGKETEAWMDEVVAAINKRPLKVWIGGRLARTGARINS